MAVVQAVNNLLAFSAPVVCLLRRFVLLLELDADEVGPYRRRCGVLGLLVCEVCEGFPGPQHMDILLGLGELGGYCRAVPGVGPFSLWDAPFHIGAATEAPRLGLGLVGWIIGHSFVFWAKQRAAARPDGQKLGFSRAHLDLKWFGFRGFGWGDVLAELIHLLNRGRRPDVILIHAGGNDLGLVPQRGLVRTMKQDINRLRDWIPGVAVVWSEIVPRFQWRHARDQVALGKRRIKINWLMSAFVRRMGGVVVRHRELEAQLPGYYRADGVHLSDIGTDFLNMGFQSGLERAIFMAEPSRLMVSRTGFVTVV
ncbi:uncharacterized protein RCH25_017636 [Pelodytes ibericus]